MERTKVKTMDLKGKAYAQVKDRLSQFRTENPHGSITTTPIIQEDGQILFKALILKDKSSSSSAEASGHALGKNTGDKAFEKLETIAVGRALALLGYATDGEIASSEEMDEYLEHKAEIRVSQEKFWIERLESAKKLTDLQKTWAEMPPEFKKTLDGKKNEVKAILSAEAKSK